MCSNAHKNLRIINIKHVHKIQNHNYVKKTYVHCTFSKKNLVYIFTGNYGVVNVLCKYFL